MSDPWRDDGWSREDLAALRTALGSGPGGLASIDADRRLLRVGRNEVRRDPARSIAVELGRRFSNPLILVLVVASVLAAATGSTVGAALIVAMLVVSVVLDYVQEARAGHAALRLRRSVDIQARVVRDGVERRVPVAQIVPGDLARLDAGSIVPADGVLVESRHLYIDQSLLTGEPFPVARFAGTAPGPDVTASSSVVRMGTAVISGTATMLAVATGPSTALGRITLALEASPPPTAYERDVRRFGAMVTRLAVLLVLFVLLTNVLANRPAVDSFLFALALAVGLTPELLPMVVSVTLARGAIEMAGRGVVVKRLAAMHDLGAMTVLATDKTGTLTQAAVTLERHCDIDGTDSDEVVGWAWLNSHFEGGTRNALDRAILRHGGVDPSGWHKHDEIPYDFDRRRVSVLIERDGERWLVVKGAPEDLLARSSRFRTVGAAGASAFDDRSRERASRLLERLSSDGYRVLGIAVRRMPADVASVGADTETDLEWVGYASFVDPPKPSAAEAIRSLASIGIDVRIVTGDGERVTRHLCERLGLVVRGVLTGEDVDRLDDAALRSRVAQTNLFCRVTPAQKSRVVLALKASGAVTGFLGDGINDAPALRVADVGVSVDTAADVAMEAADLILRRQDLGVLHEGVLAGRRTHVNIRKYLMMGTSSNFGNMLSMAAAAALLPFLPMLPMQVLLNNVLYDVSEIAIPLDRVAAGETATPQTFDLAFVRRFMFVFGPLSSLFDLATFATLYFGFHAGEAVFRTAWFVESIATQVLVIFVVRARGSPFACPPHPALVATSLGVVAVAATLPATPLGPLLGFVPLTPPLALVLVALVASYLVLAEATKRVFYRSGWSRPSGAPRAL
ncbi:MAG: magnesium-translocating P-type ATPase [Burkholderiales bacterium]